MRTISSPSKEMPVFDISKVSVVGIERLARRADFARLGRYDVGMYDQEVQRITIASFDLTAPPSEMGVDTIVNAANNSLLGGGGVDGAIHRAAGPELLKFNQTLEGCETGLAKASPAFDLESQGIKHIVHTVGPIWPSEQNPDEHKLGYTREDVLLASCYTRSLDLARSVGSQAVAFPGISTGVYGFPKERAAKIALAHVLAHLAQNQSPIKVVFCCYPESDAEIYQQAIDTRTQWMTSRKRI